MDKHDVCKSPLSPYWQRKVDEAWTKYPPPWGSTPARSTRTASVPANVPPSVEGREEIFQALWNGGVPNDEISAFFELGGSGRASEAALTLFARGYPLHARGRGWRAPADWRERLDSIIEADG